jgi:hypothetical protein
MFSSFNFLELFTVTFEFRTLFKPFILIISTFLFSVLINVVRPSFLFRIDFVIKSVLNKKSCYYIIDGVIFTIFVYSKTYNVWMIDSLSESSHFTEIVSLNVTYSHAY